MILQFADLVTVLLVNATDQLALRLRFGQATKRNVTAVLDFFAAAVHSTTGLASWPLRRRSEDRRVSLVR
jgi:hypothetical protein